MNEYQQFSAMRPVIFSKRRCINITNACFIRFSQPKSISADAFRAQTPFLFYEGT